MTLTDGKTTFSHIYKRLISIALPMASVQFITMASSFLCIAMLARLGHDVLAASALFFSAQMAIMGTGMSILFSLGILVGHAYGAKEYLNIGNYVQQGWSLGILISLPIIIIYLNIESILLLLGQSSLHAHIVKTYFHAYAWGVIPFLFAISNQQLCYGIRKQNLVTITNLLCVIILLPTAYVLIYGKFGFPKLGVAGLGYAMAIQGWFYFIFTTACFYLINDFKKFDLFRYRVHRNWGYLKRMFAMGWPISLQTGGETLSFVFAATMIGWLGSQSLAASQIVTQYRFLILIPIFALSQACGVLVGYACGEKKFHEVKLLGQASILLTLMITGVIALIFLFLPSHLASFYMNVTDPTNATVMHMVTGLFFIVAFAQIIDGIRNVLTGSLRGLFDTRYPMLAGILALWLLGMPLAYTLAFPCHLGVIGITLGSTLGMTIGLILVLLRWYRLSNNYQTNLLLSYKT